MKTKTHHPDLFGADTTQPNETPKPETSCGKKAFGFMPACVLPKDHSGDCEDGFGGHYNHSEPNPAQVVESIAERLPVIHDWHDPRNEACEQNKDVSADCTCKKVRQRKNYTKRKVHDNEAPHGISPDIIVELYPNGLIVLRERGKRRRYETTAGRIFAGCAWSAAMSAKREKAAARKARKVARK